MRVIEKSMSMTPGEFGANNNKVLQVSGGETKL